MPIKISKPKTASIYRGVLEASFTSFYVAGYTSRAGNTLLADFILFAQKLEQLGFSYRNGKVMVQERENV